MVTYNPKEWFKLIFHFHKSDTFRILFSTMLVLGALTAIVCFVEQTYFRDKIPTLTIFHQIAGFIISLVLVFRINTAYDRWWEGRKLWGSLINNARTLAIRLNAIVPAGEMNTRSELNELIVNFPFALKEHLRNNNTKEDIKFNSRLLEEEYMRKDHKPNFILLRLTEYCLEISKKNSNNDYLILSENLNHFSDICGACERIKNTPIPYSYSIFIKKMIFLYIITMPISFGLSVGYWAVPIVIILFYAFASLELISEEIEDPFGTDSNDLPTDEISIKVKNNVREILFSDGN